MPIKRSKTIKIRHFDKKMIDCKGKQQMGGKNMIKSHILKKRPFQFKNNKNLIRNGGGSKKMVESQIQQSIIEWANLHCINGIKIIDYLLAIPNGGARSASEGARFKREGVKAGVSDLFLAYPRLSIKESSWAAGLWIEVKTESKSSKLSNKQKEWMDRMIVAGYCIAIVRNLEEFVSVIYEYLKPSDSKIISIIN